MRRALPRSTPVRVRAPISEKGRPDVDTEWHFPMMIGAALLEFALVLRLVLGGEVFHRRRAAVAVVTGCVVVLGMLIGKYGAGAGLPWWIYYPVPALMTLLLPPLTFRMPTARTALYLLLALLSAPAIHVAFSVLLGWKEYMPFLPVPSLAELLG
jgi:hypothetical protein